MAGSGCLPPLAKLPKPCGGCEQSDLHCNSHQVSQAWAKLRPLLAWGTASTRGPHTQRRRGWPELTRWYPPQGPKSGTVAPGTSSQHDTSKRSASSIQRQIALSIPPGHSKPGQNAAGLGLAPSPSQESADPTHPVSHPAGPTNSTPAGRAQQASGPSLHSSPSKGSDIHTAPNIRNKQNRVQKTTEKINEMNGEKTK